MTKASRARLHVGAGAAIAVGTASSISFRNFLHKITRFVCNENTIGRQGGIRFSYRHILSLAHQWIAG